MFKYLCAIFLAVAVLVGCETNDLSKVLEGSIQIGSLNDEKSHAPSKPAAAVTRDANQTSPKDAKTSEKKQTTSKQVTAVKNEGELTETIPLPALEHSENQNRIPVEVRHVSDGDTITIAIDGIEAPVRFLLVDTPEVHGEKAENGPQFMGPEASEFTKNIIKNAKTIEIEKDKGGDSTDRYGRRLYYVYADGKMIQWELLSRGLAAVRYVFEPNTKYLDDSKKIEEEAKEKKIGIWSVPGYSTDRYNMEVYYDHLKHAN